MLAMCVDSVLSCYLGWGAHLPFCLQYGIEPAVALWNTAWPDLVSAACKESELEVVTYMLMSLAQCVAGMIKMRHAC